MSDLPPPAILDELERRLVEAHAMLRSPGPIDPAASVMIAEPSLDQPVEQRLCAVKLLTRSMRSLD